MTFDILSSSQDNLSLKV